MIAGKNYIFTTSDGGEQWSPIYYNGGENFISALCVTPANIYAGNDLGNIYNSKDTGKTWTSEHPTSFPINSIYTTNGTYIYGPEIYALTTDSLFIKSEYPPSSWHNWGALGYFYGLGSAANKGEYSDNGTAYIVGVQGDFIAASVIIRLRPPDSHWYSVGPSSEIGELYGLTIPSTEYIYSCGVNGKILKSSNEGDYWISQKTPTTQRLNSISFFNNEKGFAVGDSGTILYTSNGGISPQNNPPWAFHLVKPINEDSIYSLPKSIGFTWQRAIDIDSDIVRYTLLLSADTCSTWKSYGPTTDTTLQVQWPDDMPTVEKYFWAVIANDEISATPSLDVFSFNIITIADVEELNNNTPNKFSLFQNYPNPFNPNTTIKYTIPFVETHRNASVQLKIYDILGREVVTLVNERKSPGEYEVQFNGSNFPSGVYFYKLQAGSFSDTKKFVLLK